MQVGAMKHRILVVEDDPAERVGMAELLRLWGYRTDTARDGFEALEKMLSFVPDLVVSDLNMPLMNGLELLQRLKHQRRVVSSIIITGRATPSEKRQGIALGAFALLEKPVDSEELKAEVTNCLQSQQIRSPVAPGAETMEAASRRWNGWDHRTFWSKLMQRVTHHQKV